MSPLGMFGAPDVERLRAEADVPGLVKALRHRVPRVRASAASALGEVGDARALEPLLSALADRDASVWTAAHSALGNLSERPGTLQVDTLARALQDEHSRVWIDAVHLLGKIPEAPGAVEALTGALSAPPALLRQIAAQELAPIRDPRAVEQLLALLSDENMDVRVAALEALGRTGDTRAVEPLLESLGQAESREEVRGGIRKLGHYVMGALGRIGDPRAVDPLLIALGDADPDWRYHAVKALGEIGDPRATDGLAEVLASEDRTRWAAAEALGRIGGPRAVELLVKALGDELDDVRWCAADGLAEIGDHSAIEPLAAALTGEPRREGRERLSQALNRLGAPLKEVDPESARLQELASAGNWRELAALGEMGARAIVHELEVEGASDASFALAVEVLGEMRYAGALPLLADALERLEEMRESVFERVQPGSADINTDHYRRTQGTLVSGIGAILGRDETTVAAVEFAQRSLRPVATDVVLHVIQRARDGIS